MNQIIDNSSVTPRFEPSPPALNPRSSEGWRSVLSALLLLGAALGIALMVAAFIIQSYQVDGESMEMTLQDDDRLIVNKLPRTISSITRHQYVPDRGDIIIFNQNGVFDNSSTDQKQLIKRVIGLPGDRVVIKDGVVTIYNDENPLGIAPDERGDYEVSGETTGTLDITLAGDEIFVCGDNRPNSEDSRYFGPVKTEQIVGKLILRVFPLNKADIF